MLIGVANGVQWGFSVAICGVRAAGRASYRDCLAEPSKAVTPPLFGEAPFLTTLSSLQRRQPVLKRRSPSVSLIIFKDSDALRPQSLIVCQGQRRIPLLWR